MVAARAARCEAPGRESDDQRRAAGPLSGKARGWDAEVQIPEARRPAQPRAEMARRRGRASRSAGRLPDMAGLAAGEPSGECHRRHAAGDLRPRSVGPRERGAAARLQARLTPVDDGDDPEQAGSGGRLTRCLANRKGLSEANPWVRANAPGRGGSARISTARLRPQGCGPIISTLPRPAARPQ
jgi:hypothetical protein